MTESSIKKIRVPQNPFLLFLPLLIFYILFICIFTHTEPWGDETRNLRDINNLLHGSFSPPPPDIILGSGPGYQLLVLPFAALHLPLLTIKLLNAVFLYLSVVFLFKVLIRLVSFKKAALFSLFWGCYYNSFDFLPVMYSETITLLLISLLLFCMMNVFTPDEKIGSKKYIFLSGIVFGYLILTKVIFAYVLICMLLGIGFLWLLNRKAVNYKKSFLILLIAAIAILPYLFYTYQLTGRVFYLSTQSGNNLYWMSSPEENEYGSWFASQLHPKDSVQAAAEIVPKEKSTIDFKARGYYLPGYEDTIARLHKKDMAELSQYEYSGLELDDAYKRIAMDNIKAHPFKYIKNCFSNIGRILFNYPYSYSLQKPTTLLRFPLNGLILLLMLVCAIPTFKNWKQIPFAIRFMLFAVFIYLGGSLLGCAEIRMFTVAVPVLLVWIACIMEKSVRISFGKWQ